MSPELEAYFARVRLQRARVFGPLVLAALAIGLAVSGPFVIHAAAIAVVLASTVALYRRRVPDRWANPVAALIWWAAIATSLTSFAVTGNQRMFFILMIEVMMAAGGVSTAWGIATFVLFDAVWVPLALRGPDVAFWLLAMACAQLLAVMIHRLEVGALAQAEQRRIAAEARLAELQRSEQTKSELHDQLVRAQRLEAVGTLAAGLAHDMNNVLAAIMGLAEELAETVPLTPEAHDDLRQILRESERGAELTRGLLTFSRRGQYRRRQVLPIGELLGGVTTLLGRTLPKAIEVDSRVAEPDACVEGDPAQLGQALVNLGINAADAMSGMGTLVLRGETATLDAARAAALSIQPGRYAKLEVADTGTGMDAHTRAHVFEPFFTTKPMGKGTGLGLSIVWGVVTKSCGTVTVESEVGKGSTFTIYLPLTERAATHVTPSGGIARVAQRGTVLVVDDEPIVLRATARMLQRLGLRVIDASGGEEALALYERHAEEIGLVVLDMGMPGMTGADVFRALRAKSKVKVVIATGYAVERDVQELVDLGARVLEKPYKVAALEAEIDRALSRGAPAVA